MNKTNTEDLIGKSTALFEQAKAILSNAESTAEDRATVPAMLEDAKRLKAEAAQMTVLTCLSLRVSISRAGKENRTLGRMWRVALFLRVA